MNYSACSLRRASGIHATDSRAVTRIVANYRVSARWAKGRHFKFNFASVALALDTFKYLGNYLSRLANNNGIAYPDIPLLNKIEIMECVS